MKLGRNRVNDPAKERKLSTGVNRAAQFGAVIFTLCFGATSAFAADLPAPAPIPPPAYLPPVYNWTGFSSAATLALVGAGSATRTRTFPTRSGSTFSAATSVQFLGGGQLGVNYEFANGIVIRRRGLCSIGLPTAKMPRLPPPTPAVHLPPDRDVKCSMVDDREWPAAIDRPGVRRSQGAPADGGSSRTIPDHSNHAQQRAQPSFPSPE